MNNIENSRDDEITLRILDEINREAAITQRTLSSKLNIALGLVNAYMKRLAKKGYIKITKGPMKRVKYALTPSGFKLRVGLTYNYMNQSITYFGSVRKKIDETYRQMLEKGVEDILIWGDGEVAELAYISMRGLPLRLVGVVDSRMEEKGFFGHDVYSFEDFKDLKYDVILVTSLKTEEAMEQIKGFGADMAKVYTL
ncbi:MAG: winged helix-turn-helix domain-containing protein [Nitrospirae bacterium]|nr:winged helix-turn-helix domain-containing protein [Nitrospirota bacterium]